MSDPVEIALITGLTVGLPSIISSFIWGWTNRRKINTIEQNTNNKLDQILDQRNAASTRADRAEGHAEGVTAEQDRTTKGT
jgi:hypothetical protein